MNYTSKEIITAFKQGGEGNCVAIAAIKAGIEIFGINQIFNYQFVDNLHKVTMRDGYTLDFTNEEFNLAKDNSLFECGTSKEIFDYANLAFAAMAKRAQHENNDNKEDMTYSEAINSLNDGENYREGPDWLGLRHYIRPVGRKYVWKYPGVIGASPKHCFFVSHGIEDKYGNPDRLTRSESLFRFIKFFRIANEPIY